MMNQKKNRRQALKNLALGSAVLGTAGVSYSCQPENSSEGSALAEADAATEQPYQLKGNIKHSVCRWCYNDIPLETFLEQCKEIGLASVELLEPHEWDLAEKYGLDCAVATDFSFANIEDGFNDPNNHQHLQDKYVGLIDAAAERGYPTVIVFSGNRRGMDDETGWENCAKGLEPLVKQAEQRGITIIMELLNSKVNHIDYMCDYTPWGVALVDKIGSDRFKLLYDIYHMQIMEGDVIATIEKYQDYIAHYHTGGVPGRNEIDDTQELYYPAIMKAIVETGYQGYVGQEFIPAADDKLASLASGVRICDV